MGLSKLSERCEKCGHKNSCDNKRMEACAYIELIPKSATGGIVNQKDLFISPNNDREIIGSLGKPIHGYSDKIIDSIHKALECKYKGSVM
jgi:hypothetical protein